MFKNTLTAACVLLAAAPAFAIDQTVRPVDPSNFDVAGVRLGMPAAEAAAAAAAKLGVGANAVQYDKPSMNQLVKAKVPGNFTVQSGKSKLTVSLLPREPVDAAKTLVVSEIKYVMEPSPQAEEAISKSALAKYGKPSVARGMTSSWCAKPNVTIACMGDRGPQLHVFGVTVQLMDESLSKVKIAAKGEAPKPAF
ncbi:hypothetical protein SAMN05518865_119102 [Duganella sp. CF458]|uniref:hypothetical protein n=1 Tax=Duganella sp. CF458 TaxID=1884368 RepID=UPI0008EBFE52|nr:hypothetical protein [Duganella sp. CF458]SFG82720.1 hypothetical protein SAMN05518865_119102 [Duganella sp. CF458]